MQIGAGSMNDRPARNEYERNARRELFDLVSKLLRSELSFLEGAVEVVSLRDKIGGIRDRDPDFEMFTAITSETDHLPLKKFQHLWADKALERLAPEFRSAEKWASEVGQEACRNLLSRFRQDD